MSVTLPEGIVETEPGGYERFLEIAQSALLVALVRSADQDRAAGISSSRPAHQGEARSGDLARLPTDAPRPTIATPTGGDA